MTAPPKWKMSWCYICAWSMVISTPLACCSITFSAAQLLISTVELAKPEYSPEAWHTYLGELPFSLAQRLLDTCPNCHPTASPHDCCWHAYVALEDVAQTA